MRQRNNCLRNVIETYDSKDDYCLSKMPNQLNQNPQERDDLWRLCGQPKLVVTHSQQANRLRDRREALHQNYQALSRSLIRSMFFAMVSNSACLASSGLSSSSKAQSKSFDVAISYCVKCVVLRMPLSLQAGIHTS